MKRTAQLFLIFVMCCMLTSLLAGQNSQPAQRGPRTGGRNSAPAKELGKPPMAKSDAEKKVLAVLAAMGKDRGRRYRSISERDGRFMRQVAAIAGAKRIVEIGTSTGYSGLWFCLALQGTGGKLITHELDEGRAKTAMKNFKEAGVDSMVTLVQGNAHETVKKLKEPIDVLFLDADKQGYIDYLEKLLPLIKPGGVIMAHNMVYPTPDPNFIKAITTDPKLETSFMLMDGAGISLTIKKR